jgi:hypothetical protein
VAAGRPIRYLVPEAVAGYIADERPLRGTAGGGRVSGSEHATAPEPEGAGLASLIEAYAADKKAIDARRARLRGCSGYTDFLRRLLGQHGRQTQGDPRRIHQGLKKKHGLLPRAVEGLARRAGS